MYCQFLQPVYEKVQRNYNQFLSGKTAIDVPK